MSEQKTCTACSENSREALVSWGDPEYTYMGRVNDSFTWNGWFVPAFTAQEVRRMANETRGVKGLAPIDEQEGGSFVIQQEEERSDEGYEAITVRPTECCGLYFIGDWWTWAEVNINDLQPYEVAILRNAEI